MTFLAFLSCAPAIVAGRNPRNKALINENEFSNLQNLHTANLDICGIKFASILNA